jgi:hypothetical protein
LEDRANSGRAAERAAKAKLVAKAIGLVLFFLLMVAFPFTTSVDRAWRQAETVAARSRNERVKLAREGYEAARAECGQNRHGDRLSCSHARAGVKLQLV